MPDLIFTLKPLKPSITLHHNCLDITIGLQGLAASLGIFIDGDAGRTAELRCDAVRVRRGHEVRLVIAEASIALPTTCDAKLVALLAEAQAAAKMLFEHLGQSLSAIGKKQGRCRTRLGKLIEWSCLAPDIITAIVNGRHPAQLDSKTLLAAIIPIDWHGQRKLLGFRPNH
jgi:site-specific DNA recombinase